MICTLLLALAATGSPAAEPLKAPLSIERGAGQLAFEIPAEEELEFSVAIDLGAVGMMRLGSVTVSAEHGVLEGPLPGVGESRSEPTRYASIQSRASGNYLGYVLDHRLQTRYLIDQAWPRIIYTDTQAGSENRRRELRLGSRDGAPAVSYRSDHHCGGCEREEHLVEPFLPWGADEHCDKCRRGEHRTWKEFVDREAPEGTLDMLSALFLARAMVVTGRENLSFPMLDKLELWNVVLRLGEKTQKRTGAGEFACREVSLTSSVPPSETRTEDPKFSGLFGIRGELRVFVDENTGVPIWIEGTVPAGPLDLEVVVRLESHSGTNSKLGVKAPL